LENQLNQSPENLPDSTDQHEWQNRSPHVNSSRREPAFNLPPIIILFSLLFVIIHAARTYLLTSEQDFQVILQFSFIPAYFTFPLDEVPYPASRYWSYLSYALLHGDWTHVFVNLLWTVAFGSVVARRFGGSRFFAFSAIAAIAGALAHFAMHSSDITPVIGASASVSAYMGAAIRFVLGPGGLAAGQQRGVVSHPPAMSLIQALTNRNFILFVGVWLGLNLLFGTGLVPIAGEGVQIAWEAHVGGFVYGLLAFSLFDPVGRR
jgi:membrane associated rhomboid family serine protease